MAIGGAQRLLSAIGAVFSSERLDELPEARGGPAREPFVSRLMKSESLPQDEPAPGGGGQLLRLFSSEELPFDSPPDAHNARASFVATLMSGEQLPLDPPPGAHPGRRAAKGSQQS